VASWVDEWLNREIGGEVVRWLAKYEDGWLSKEIGG
jgi:hypothetical protein